MEPMEFRIVSETLSHFPALLESVKKIANKKPCRTKYTSVKSLRVK